MAGPVLGIGAVNPPTLAYFLFSFLVESFSYFQRGTLSLEPLEIITES